MKGEVRCSGLGPGWLSLHRMLQSDAAWHGNRKAHCTRAGKPLNEIPVCPMCCLRVPVRCHLAASSPWGVPMEACRANGQKLLENSEWCFVRGAGQCALLVVPGASSVHYCVMPNIAMDCALLGSLSPEPVEAPI